jgi:NADPH-dependent 2,4-dienoyl-CoA reductase/sulfur reductase-like enzyme
VLAGKLTVGEKVAIIGGGEVGCETADYVGERGAREITIMARATDVALDMLESSRVFLMERLSKYPVVMLTSVSVKEILDDGIAYVRDGKEESIRGIDTIILARGTMSVDDLSKKIQGSSVGAICDQGCQRTPQRA